MRGGTLASISFRMPFFYLNTFNKGNHEENKQQVKQEEHKRYY